MRAVSELAVAQGVLEAGGVPGQQRVEDGVGNLVAHLVRVALGDRLGREEE